MSIKDVIKTQNESEYAFGTSNGLIIGKIEKKGKSKFKFNENFHEKYLPD